MNSARSAGSSLVVMFSLNSIRLTRKVSYVRRFERGTQIVCRPGLASTRLTVTQIGTRTCAALGSLANPLPLAHPKLADSRRTPEVPLGGPGKNARILFQQDRF